MKRFMWSIFAGALLGAVLFAWLSPQIISWYFSPPADLAITCSPAVTWALNTYRKVIFTGMLLGAMVATIIYFAVRSNKAHKSAQAVPPEAQN